MYCMVMHFTLHLTGAEYEVKPASAFYAVGGSLDDTMYQEGTIGMGYTIELRDDDRSG